MTDDSTLLQRYAANRDEAAFAEVVRRHLPFVYAAALRRLGRDTPQAPDVAQLVFCALARDARRIARYPVLSGWLYTATRNAVSNVVRGEKRRRIREEEAFHMQQIESEPDASADWSKLRPVLDSALDRLGARDREAVLLRFFEGRSFGEIGALAGVSEDAARKRLDRALARLRDLLRPHGVASTSTALAALLASQPVSAAPAGLLASVTGAALATGGAGATGIATFITMTKLQTGIVATLLVAGAVGLFLQQRTIAQLREEVAVAQGRLATLSGDNGAVKNLRGRADAAGAQADPARSGSAAEAARPPTAPGELLAETKAALGHGKVPERYFSFVAILQKLSRDNWREVLQAFEEEQKRTGLVHPEVFEIFARHAGEVAGKDVVGYFLQKKWNGDANEAMIGWASKNPTEALQWLGREADAETRRRVMAGAIRGLALTEPDLAVKVLEDQPANERNKYVDELVTSMLRPAGIDGVQRLVEGMIARAAEAGRLKEDYLKSVFTNFAAKRIGQSEANGTMAEVVDWLNPHIGQPYLDRRLVAETALRFARQNPQETLRWLEKVNTTLLPIENDTVGYRVTLDVWRSNSGAPAVETWLQAQAQTHPHYDWIAWQYAALVAGQDPNKAAKWVGTIKDPAIKQKAQQELSQRVAKGKS